MSINNIKIGVFRLAASYIPMARAKLEEEKKKVVDGAVEKYFKARQSSSVRYLPN